MSLYAENGSYTMAIRLYNDLKRRLSRDLSEEPSKGLKELFQRIYNMKETVQAGEAGAYAFLCGQKKRALSAQRFSERTGRSGKRPGSLRGGRFRKNGFLRAGNPSGVRRRIYCVKNRLL